MTFVGFGFLMSYLKTYCWSSVGFTLLLACWSLQLFMVLMPFLEQWMLKGSSGTFTKIELDLSKVIESQYAAVALIVSLGAVIGKSNWSQLFMFGTFECVFYCINKVVMDDFLMVKDVGGSVQVHLFGAFFGLAAASWFTPKWATEKWEDRN